MVFKEVESQQLRGELNMSQTAAEKLRRRVEMREAEVEYERYHYTWAFDWFAGRTPCMFTWAKRKAVWEKYFALW